ncbi:hypothetical protein BW723_03565 [Polaribacter reichenbachii]|uniref:DUF3857 domain-containing protein n=1 Tax=Polaribacter reichenbachii TaxID=996801 RepID=A0A1B8TVE6_9FLAO|nr:DUF3857 domain-containing protein [Polaribacter reichenbachii]APZ45434.1 hypothetical protein BW723_03565 [Polaribacter reichenbachii]AUC19295.1 hypothetical protein BTO17_11570 [Polaribacter reichenbachii]OBY63550.1 hypothetical protein LPB301_12135 [Polaribacter reichenbachii]
MKKYIFTLILFVTTLVNFAQTIPFYKSYDWEENPAHNVDKSSNENLIALKEKIVTEFHFEEQALVEYFLEHKILWLNSDDAIEEFNKIYLPFSSDSELQINKARVIDTDGKIINLDESKILTAQDEETGRQYKYFAFEGITKGSFIEYLYVVKKDPAYMGKKLNIQDDYPKNKIEFDLLSPSNLTFAFKSFNGLPEVKQDTLNKDKFHYKLYLKDLKKLDNEYLSAYNAAKGYVVYKIDKNIANNTSDIVSYSKVSQNLYSFYYPEYENKTTGLISKFIEELEIPENTDEETIIRRLESYIKSNVYSSEAYSDELQDLDLVLTKKVANETGTLKLYISLLRTFNIKHELVLTSSRDQIKFDKTFEANNFLTDFLIYFPKHKKYLEPSAQEKRYGFPTPFLMDNYGLFIKEVKIGDYKSAVGKVKYIEPVQASETEDTMVVDIAFNPDDLTENIIHFDRSLGGYYAGNIQPFMHFIIGDDRDELVDNIIESITSELTIEKREIVNGESELFGVKPLQFIVDFTSEAFVEKAGRKYLFKLGDIIGPQMQMYQEKERVLPLEQEFHRSYYRTINIKIPDGYKITNLDDINIDNSYSEDGEELFSFKSFYELNGDVLKITADEHYRENIIKVALYEEYRTVINSAADFNKIVLLLEPK